MKVKRGARSQQRRSIQSAIVAAMYVLAVTLPATPAKALTRSIIFPVIGDVQPNNDFGDPRAGHTHAGNDIIGKKMMPLVAVADGTVRFVTWPEADYGYLASIEDSDGYQYWYLHINNDHIGTDDGLGGGKLAYAPDIDNGDPVVKGQLIGWMGDSGNAESTSSHLHFELHDPSGTPIDPYPSLSQATRISQPTNPPPLPGETWPFGDFRGGAHLTFGQIDRGTPDEELIISAAAGGGPLVRIFQTSGEVVGQFFAYPKEFRGGVDVAAADLDGDGIDEIITVPGPGGGPQVKIFSAKGELLTEYYAYSPLFKNGISVAAADMNSDGKAEIITGSGPGMEPRVKVFSPDGTILDNFIPYDPHFHGGIDVAAMAAVGLNPAMIVTGPGRGGGPDVHIFTPDGQPLGHFFAFAQDFRGGVRVDIADVLTDNDVDGVTPEIVVVPASSGGPQVQTFTLSGEPVLSKFAFERWWNGGYDVAASQGLLYMSSGTGPRGPGGRRASVQVVSTNSNPWWFNSSALSNRDDQFGLAREPGRL